MTASTLRRIIIVGCTNSGKSTLGLLLAERLGAAFIELDALYWEPDWVAAEPSVFRQRVCSALEADSWVIAGNYTTTQQDLSWPQADTIVWLDLPLRAVLRRCLARTWRRYRSQELLWGTNRENLWRHLMLWNPDKSLIRFTFVHHRGCRRKLEPALRDPRWSHVTFVRLTSADEVARWLKEQEQLGCR